MDWSDYSLNKGAQLLVLTLGVMYGVYFFAGKMLERGGGEMLAGATGVSPSAFAGVLALCVTLLVDFFFVKKMLSEKPSKSKAGKDIDDFDASPKAVARMAEIKYGGRRKGKGGSFGKLYGFEK